MNSIESYSPTTLASVDAEKIETPDLSSDPELLAMLRSMMGGVAIPAPASTMPSPVQVLATSSSAIPGTESAELLALLATLQESFSTNANATSDPEVVKQMQQLLSLLGSDAPSSTEGIPADASLTNAVVGSANSDGTVPSVSSSVISTSSTMTDADQSIPLLLQALAQSATNPSGSNGDTQKTADSIRLDLIKALTEATSPSTSSVQAEADPALEVNAQPMDDMAGLGSSILSSIGQQSSSSAAAAGAPPSSSMTAERVEQVSSLMTQMADRVLVTDPLHGQNAEVRIKLADSLIPGTEVRVWREQGQLHVSFDTASAYWARVLNEASPLLSQRLQERLPHIDPAQVTVFHQGGQPEDGRSRNRHNAWELAQQALEA